VFAVRVTPRQPSGTVRRDGAVRWFRRCRL